MDLKNIESYMERIAIALEKISDKIGDVNQGAYVKKEYSTIEPNNKVIFETNIEFESSHVNDPSEIIGFLLTKDIKVKNVKPEDEAYDVLDSISLFLGDTYSKVKKIYDLIKRNMNSGGSFRLDLKNLQQDEIASITQLCTNLHQIAFLEEYKY